MADLTFPQVTARAYTLTDRNGHSRNSEMPHHDSFVDLDKEQLKRVADELSKGESALNFAPQVIVRKFNGEVKCITYSAGILDSGAEPRQKLKGDVNALIKTNLDERSRLKAR